MPVGDPPPLPRATTGPLGWECPRCHATYAPWMASCTECKPSANSLRRRIEEAQPPAVLPVAPYAPPLVYPLYPAPQWPYGQQIWCDTTAQFPAMLSPEARLRMTQCSGAGVGQSYTVTVSHGVNYELDAGREDDDGTAGVPARV